MKNMTDRVANKVAGTGTWNRWYKMDQFNKVILTVERIALSIWLTDAVKAGEKAENFLRSVSKDLEKSLYDSFGNLEGGLYKKFKPSIHVSPTRSVAVGCSGIFEWDVDSIWEEWGGWYMYREPRYDENIDDDILEHAKKFLKKEGFDER